jgi:hypothetical protein
MRFSSQAVTRFVLKSLREGFRLGLDSDPPCRRPPSPLQSATPPLEQKCGSLTGRWPLRDMLGEDMHAHQAMSGCCPLSHTRHPPSPYEIPPSAASIQHTMFESRCGGGRDVVRVEVSIDGGKNWQVGFSWLEICTRDEHWPPFKRLAGCALTLVPPPSYPSS